MVFGCGSRIPSFYGASARFPPSGGSQIIATDSASRDVLEHLVVMTQHTPRPVVMFAADDARETIREAVRAGVSAYVIDGIDSKKIRGIVDAAVASFDQMQGLRTQLAEAN